MPLQLSPAVKIVENDLSLTLRQQPSTNIIGILRSDYGEALTPIRITNERELAEKFGKPTNLNYQDWYDIWNALQYTSSVYVVRPTSLTAKNAGISLDGGGKQAVQQEDPDNPGQYINVELNTPASINYVAQDNLYNSKKAELTISSLVINSKLTFFNKYVTSEQKIAVAVCSNKEYWNLPILNTTNRVFDYSIQDASGYILPFSSFFDYAPNFDNDEFVLLVFEKNSDGLFELVEKYILSYKENGRDVFGNNIFVEKVLFEKSKYLYAKTNSSISTKVNTCYNTELPSLKISSDDCVYPKAGSLSTNNLVYTGSYTSADIINAYDIFREPEELDIDVIIGHPLNLNYAAELAAYRQDCIAIIGIYDTTELIGKSATEATTYIINQYGSRSTLLNKKFGVYNTYTTIYGNMKYQYDKFNDVNRWVSVSGDIAGLIAETSYTKEDWYAVAGLERGKIKNCIKLAFNPSKQNRDDLYINSINPVISIPGEGMAIVFGQKTATLKDSAFSRLNVRRLLLSIKKTLNTQIKYFLFEFNDFYTRNRVFNTIDPYLKDIKGRRGLYDYKVVCDETNNTPEVIDRNELIVDIYLKPTRTAEFILITLNVTKTSANFNEFIGKA